MKIVNIIAFLVYIIIFIKIVFLISTIGHLIFSHHNKNSSKSKKLDEKFVFWKERTEFIFTILMAILLIFIFNPRSTNQKYITKEMGFLFYLFGFILIITSDWSIIFKEPDWFKQIRNAINL